MVSPVGAVVVRPERGLGEAHPVEGLPGAVSPPERKLLGIAEVATDALHVADGAPRIMGRSDMAEREGPSHHHPVAHGEAGRHQPAPSPRFSTSAMRRPSSSEEMTPSASKVLVIEAIQRS